MYAVPRTFSVCNNMSDKLNCFYSSWEELSRNFTSNDLSFLCLNARSIINKFTELKLYLSSLSVNFSFIIITETWLKSNTDVALEIDGYQSKLLYRVGVGGGIKVYYLNSINVTVLDNFTLCNSIYESLMIKANIPGFGEIILCCFYRIPNNSFSHFSDALRSCLQFCESNRAFICGDFNIDLSGHDNLHSTQAYRDLMFSYGLIPQINLPTHVFPSNLSFKSCLDHAWHHFPVHFPNFLQI